TGSVYVGRSRTAATARVSSAPMRASASSSASVAPAKQAPAVSPAGVADRAADGDVGAADSAEQTASSSAAVSAPARRRGVPRAPCLCDTVTPRSPPADLRRPISTGRFPLADAATLGPWLTGRG